ncbi:MAG: glycosyltransferase, partial [bacterium]
TPLVSATEQTIYTVLKELISNPERRLAVGGASRAHALKWWSADACAERFERVYDRLMAGLPPMEQTIGLKIESGNRAAAALGSVQDQKNLEL